MTEAQDSDGLKMAVLGFCALLLLVYLEIRCAEAGSLSLRNCSNSVQIKLWSLWDLCDIHGLMCYLNQSFCFIFGFTILCIGLCL